MEKTIGPSPTRDSQYNRFDLNLVNRIPYRRMLVSSIGAVSSTLTNTTNSYSIYNLLPYADSWSFQDGIDIIDQSTGTSGTPSAMARIRFARLNGKPGSKIETLSYGRILSHTNNALMGLGTSTYVFIYNSAGSLQDTLLSGAGGFLAAPPPAGLADIYQYWKHRAYIQMNTSTVRVYSECAQSPADPAIPTVLTQSSDSGNFDWQSGDYLEFLIILTWTEASTDNQVTVDNHYIEHLPNT